MELTKEQYRDLKKFERHLLTASRANYVTAIYRTTADELTRIYNDVFKTNKKPSTCNKCVLDMFKRLGKLYFEFQAKQATQSDGNEPDGQPTETSQEKPTEGEKTQENEDANIKDDSDGETATSEPEKEQVKTSTPKRKYNRKKKATK